MTRDEIIQAINETVDSAISAIDKSIPGTEKTMLKELNQILRGLDYDGDRIKSTAKNIKVIGAIKNKLRKIILDASYKANVKEYLAAFNTVTTLQNNYMRQVASIFKFGPVLREIRQQAVNSAAESLTEQGLNAIVIKQLQDILRTNITAGGSYRQLTESLREVVIGAEPNTGILQRYVKGVATDSISLYSRQYLQIATDSLGMDWFLYSGSLKETSRCFCEAMRKKRYFHRAEIPALIAGNFPEWEQEGCQIYNRTGLPSGFFPGTNAANFLTNMGGYNCTHRGIPVLEGVVPLNIRETFYAAYPSYRPKA